MLPAVPPALLTTGRYLAFGLIALPLAFISDRFVFPGKGLLGSIILVPMILPPFVGAIGIKQIFGQYGALNALIVGAGLPMDDVRGFTAWLKVRPGEVNFGSSGDGSTGHLAGELLRVEAGLKVLHVPYKGESPAFTDLVGGQTAYMFSAALGVAAHIASGKLRLLAVPGKTRSPIFPACPPSCARYAPGHGHGLHPAFTCGGSISPNPPIRACFCSDRAQA